ncbi:hypothetical protein D3Z51_05150 [Clostridiaceae bacterium]|nr:hypothetical protein [Clostridiaceae bacterium]RKI15595.1 hypothetical protein D7V81_06140 [bacterium 1XD21-70]
MEKIINSIRHGIAGNMILNIVSGAISIVVLQLIILPYLGKAMDESSYGLLITILALLNVIPATLGNSLNNIRLLYQNRYEEENLEGDFSIMFIFEAIITWITVIGFSIYYFNQAESASDVILHLFMLGILSVVWIAREYLIVAFLLKLDYKKIFINNCLLACGYFLGVILFQFIKYWEIIYIAGYLASLTYIFKKTEIWHEELTKTRLFPIVLKENVIYIVASLLHRITSYADKMLLYPMIGGAEISVYHVATLSSKVITLIITPISGVMLSYLSRVRNSDANRSFRTVYILGIGVCITGYFVCLIASRPLLWILYPQYVERAMEYVPITTATVVIAVLISLINPYVLRFLTMKWQVVINFATVIVYVLVGLMLLKTNGLAGFCFGCMIANMAKLLIMTLIYLFAKKRTE